MGGGSFLPLRDLTQTLTTKGLTTNRGGRF